MFCHIRDRRNHTASFSFFSLGNTVGLYLGSAEYEDLFESVLFPFTGPNDLNFIVSPKSGGHCPPGTPEGQQFIMLL